MTSMKLSTIMTVSFSGRPKHEKKAANIVDTVEQIIIRSRNKATGFYSGLIMSF